MEYKSMAEFTNDDNLRPSGVKSNNFDKFIESLNKENLGAKIYFNDGTYIKGTIINFDRYNLFLAHKKKLLSINKGSVKMIEPLS